MEYGFCKVGDKFADFQPGLEYLNEEGAWVESKQYSSFCNKNNVGRYRYPILQGMPLSKFIDELTTNIEEVKYIPVTNCLNCPYSEYLEESGTIGYCEHEVSIEHNRDKKKLVLRRKPPKWCPLPGLPVNMLSSVSWPSI